MEIFTVKNNKQIKKLEMNKSYLALFWVVSGKALVERTQNYFWFIQEFGYWSLRKITCRWASRCVHKSISNSWLDLQIKFKWTNEVCKFYWAKFKKKLSSICPQHSCSYDSNTWTFNFLVLFSSYCETDNFRLVISIIVLFIVPF